jgi:hypothetical protein
MSANRQQVNRLHAMHRPRSAALRIAVGAALSFGFYVLAWSGGSSNDTTVYAIGATPMPATVVFPPSPASSGATQPSPATPVLTPAPASAVPPPSGAPAAPSAAQTQLQQTSDQITSVSQQITQAVQDPSTSVDSKVQLINSLAAQFNQLVSIWQQQLAQITTAPPSVAGVQLTPTPAIPASPTPKPAADQQAGG